MRPWARPRVWGPTEEPAKPVVWPPSLCVPKLARAATTRSYRAQRSQLCPTLGAPAPLGWLPGPLSTHEQRRTRFLTHREDGSGSGAPVPSSACPPLPLLAAQLHTREGSGYQGPEAAPRGHLCQPPCPLRGSRVPGPGGTFWTLPPEQAPLCSITQALALCPLTQARAGLTSCGGDVPAWGSGGRDLLGG